jgi:hypothetical protein
MRRAFDNLKLIPPDLCPLLSRTPPPSSDPALSHYEGGGNVHLAGSCISYEGGVNVHLSGSCIIYEGALMFTSLDLALVMRVG